MTSLSEDVAGLSSGTYYKWPIDWYNLLVKTMSAHNMSVGPMPGIHTDEGRDHIEYDSGQVFFTWYRMESGRYEIICYVC